MIVLQCYRCLVTSMPWNPGHLASRGWSCRDAGPHGTNSGNPGRVATLRGQVPVLSTWACLTVPPASVTIQFRHFGLFWICWATFYSCVAVDKILSNKASCGPSAVAELLLCTDFSRVAYQKRLTWWILVVVSHIAYMEYKAKAKGMHKGFVIRVPYRKG